MARKYSLFQLSSVLATLLAMNSLSLPARAGQDTIDTSPGWVIILACDYDSQAGPLRVCVQRDAARAYKFMVSDWKVPPDHVLLLAQGNEIQKMVEDGDLPGRVDGVSVFREDVHNWQKDTSRARTQDLLAHLRQNASGSLSRDIDTVQSFFAPGRMLPYVADPTAANFKAALDVVGSQASDKQFITVVVSSHYKPGSLVALSDTNSLQASDIALPDSCRSERRLLVMDVTKLGDKEREDTFHRLSSEPLEQLSQQFTVVAASDGNKPSWPLPARNEKESIFLWSFFRVLKAHPSDTPLNAIFPQVASRYQAKSKSDYEIPSDPFLMPARIASGSGGTMFQTVALHERPSSARLQLVSSGQVSASTVPGTITGEDMGLVYVGTHMINLIPPIPGDPNFSAAKRARIIADRMKAVLDLKELTQADLDAIQPGIVQENGSNRKATVILMPKRIASLLPEDVLRKFDDPPFIITIDAGMARIRNESLDQAAGEMASKLRQYIVAEDARRMGDDDKSEVDLLDLGMKFFAEAQKDLQDHLPDLARQHFDSAEDDLKQATEIAPELMDAYLKLALVYLKDSKPDQAWLTLKRYQDYNSPRDVANLKAQTDYQELVRAIPDAVKGQ